MKLNCLNLLQIFICFAYANNNLCSNPNEIFLDQTNPYFKLVPSSNNTFYSNMSCNWKVNITYTSGKVVRVVPTFNMNIDYIATLKSFTMDNCENASKIDMIVTINRGYFYNLHFTENLLCINFSTFTNVSNNPNNTLFIEFYFTDPPITTSFELTNELYLEPYIEDIVISYNSTTYYSSFIIYTNQGILDLFVVIESTFIENLVFIYDSMELKNLVLYENEVTDLKLTSYNGTFNILLFGDVCCYG